MIVMFCISCRFVPSEKEPSRKCTGNDDGLHWWKAFEREDLPVEYKWALDELPSEQTTLF